MKIAAILVLLGTLSACGEPMQPRMTETGGLVYFPAGSVSDFEQEWYASQLFAMHEPVLTPSGADSDYFALRVMYLPTWGRPIAIRYEINGADGSRRAVMLSGDGGYDPGRIKIEHNNSLSAQQVAQLRSSLDESGYWNLAEHDQVSGTDGSRLILETIRGGQHRVLVRWTPEYNTDARKLTNLVAFYTAEFKSDGFWSEVSE